MILLITVLAIFQTTDMYVAKVMLNNLSKKNICTVCHRNVLAVESVHSSHPLFSPPTPSLTSPILHPPPPQNCRFLCFPIDVELSVLETVVSEKSKNFLRTTFRRGDCYKTINHGRKSHFLDGFSWLEPHDNIILVGELPCLVKHIMNSAASTAVYPCDF